MLAYGVLALGEIRPAGRVEVYTFEAKAGDVVLIVGTDTSGSDKYRFLQLEVFDSKGKSVAKGQGGWNTYNVVLTFRPTTTGKYSTELKYTGATISTYTLALNNVAEGPGTAVRYGDDVVGEIRPAGDVDLYTFEATAGEVARIRATDTSDSDNYRFLQLEVFNPQGTTMTRGQGGWGIYNVELKLDLTATGKYSIVVSYSGATTSMYTLALRKVGG